MIGEKLECWDKQNGWERRTALKLVREAVPEPNSLIDLVQKHPKEMESYDRFNLAKRDALTGVRALNFARFRATMPDTDGIWELAYRLATDTRVFTSLMRTLADGDLFDDLPGSHGGLTLIQFVAAVVAQDKEMKEGFDGSSVLPVFPDSTPPLRLLMASLLQQAPLEHRWPIAEALIAHGEDAKDHNLPQMYWYAIEPLVPANPERALELAAKSQIPLVAQHIARRLAETDGGLPHLITALGKEKTAAGTVYLLKAALQGLKGRSGEPAPPGWDGAWANIDDILARRPDAKPLAAEITDLREAVAVAFGDKRAFPRLREIVKDAKQSAERRETALQTLLDGNDPEIPGLIESLLDDPVMRLPALKALPRATGK